MKLKVGDKIYIRSWDDLVSFETILKTTKTMAVAKTYRFNLEYNCGIRIKGRSPFDHRQAQLATKDLDKEWEERKVVAWFEEKEFTLVEKKKIKNLLK